VLRNFQILGHLGGSVGCVCLVGSLASPSLAHPACTLSLINKILKFFFTFPKRSMKAKHPCDLLNYSCENSPGAPEWLSRLSVCLWLRSGSQGSGIEPRIGLPAQRGACFSLSLPLCLLVLSKKKKKRKYAKYV